MLTFPYNKEVLAAVNQQLKRKLVNKMNSVLSEETAFEYKQQNSHKSKKRPLT